MDANDIKKIAVVEAEIRGLSTAISTLSEDLKTWQRDHQTHYVPRKELTEMFRSRDQDIQELREALRETANKSDITEIKETLKELKEDRKSNKSLWAAWAGVTVSGLAVVVAIIAIIN